MGYGFEEIIRDGFMTWRGTLRTLEREAKRRERERVAENVALKVNAYNEYIELISSFHKDCGDTWDWNKIRNSIPPNKPEKTNHNESKARLKLDSYSPNVFDKVVKRSEKKKEKLIEAVKLAKQVDEREYQEELARYSKLVSKSELAEMVLNGDTSAYEKAIEQAESMQELSILGTITFDAINSTLVDATLEVNSEEVIPDEIMTQLKSGKLSVKKMPKTRFYELYQDFTCGSVLRIARELFALLPIEKTIITAMGKLLNSATGHLEDKPILSVLIPRDSLSHLSFDLLDPSDSMKNFVHNMKFLKTKGFQEVEKLNIDKFL
jgi:hypothetical protein